MTANDGGGGRYVVVGSRWPHDMDVQDSACVKVNMAYSRAVSFHLTPDE